MQVSKVNLFLEEVFALMYAFNESYDGAMSVPVEIRKWLIKRWNKQKEKEQKASSGESSTSDINKPLTPQERAKMINNAQQTRSTPSKPHTPSSMMTSMRNKSV